MNQVDNKNKQFHTQIRKRQHNQMFIKIRAKYQNMNKNSNNQHSNHRVQITALLNQLPQMYKMAYTLQSIFENQDHILKYFSSIRKYQDQQHILEQGWQSYQSVGLRGRDPNQQEKGVFVPFLQFMLYVSKNIYKHINLQMQQNFTSKFMSELKNQDDYQQLGQNRFNNILLPITYFLINLTSMPVSASYINIISQFTKFRIFVDVFFNIFLTQQIQTDTKQKCIDQYLSLLERQPRFCLNSCHIVGKVIYFILSRPPQISTLPRYNQIALKILQIIENMNSVIGFIDNPNSDNLQNIAEFKQYCSYVLQCLSHKNENLSLHIANNVNIMKSIQKSFAQLRMLSTMVGKMNEDQIKFEQLQSNLRVISNIGYWDKACISLNQNQPTIWINFLAIYEKLPIQYWISQNQNTKNIQMPPMLTYTKFKPIVLPRLLKCLINFLNIDYLCEEFINKRFYMNESQYKNNKTQKRCNLWIDVLQQIYNQNFKSMQIRVQCLSVFANALICIAQRQTFFTKKYQNSEQIENIISLTTILNKCIQLLLQTLKLTNHHNNIIISVMKSLMKIIEKAGHSIWHSQIFSDYSFRNRLTSIVQIDIFGKQQKRMQYYSENVKIHAQNLLEALTIQHP